MENTDVLDSNLGDSNLGITPEIKMYLNEAAKWANFVAIVGFVLAGLYGIIALIGMFTGMSAASQMGGGGGIMIGYLVFILIYCGILIMMSLYLYRFASNSKMAMANNNQMNLTASMQNLKRYFKLIGILIIVMLVFVILGLIFGLSMMGSIMNSGF